ncbi:thiolase family protein [Dietzia kunjamensis]|uniref:thiolase family protein n=1 Tax=Dietzia kunjamensis TaxID=322509 RepID=UPI002DB742B8|nr:thiolase family protein [Dietzia kunjamensis]MEB8326018.1 thiolase family protein [Dietzia kunjamensis]
MIEQRFAAHVLGTGVTPFGKHKDTRLEDLATPAVLAAIAEAGLEPAQISTVYVGSVFGPSGVAARVAAASGLCNASVVKVEAACASGSMAAHLAARDVTSGEAGYSIAIGVEKLSEVFDGPIVPELSDREGVMGLPMPGLYALQASNYLHRTSYAAEDLAEVAVKNRANGASNPIAHQQSAVTRAEVLSSRLIAEPLTLLQCCPMSDGAAAVVFGPAGAGDSPTGVGLLASSVAGGRGWPAPDVDEQWGMGCVGRALDGLWDRLGGQQRFDLHEVHDAFTIGEILSIEALGLVERGGGIEALVAGRFHTDGDIPVNASGGLIARGHALGATGVAQIAETVLQLQGRAGARQVAGARTALVETLGGGASGLDGNAAALLALSAC